MFDLCCLDYLIASQLNKKQKYQQQLYLPIDFAQQIFDLELILEDESINIESVRKLLDLYRMACEYYGQFNSEKHTLFIRKTQQILMMEQVQKLIFQPRPDNPKQMLRTLKQNMSIQYSLKIQDLTRQEEDIQRRLMLRKLGKENF
ncbi:hypothetical protein pb186bvf_008160 [Paramecium bursaria]